MSEKSSASPAPARGINFIDAVPDGDNRTRQVCAECGFVNYENPKIVVGSVCHWGERILMPDRYRKKREAVVVDLGTGRLHLHIARDDELTDFELAEVLQRFQSALEK
jgi:hypothetical protein